MKTLGRINLISACALALGVLGLAAPVAQAQQPLVPMVKRDLPKLKAGPLPGPVRMKPGFKPGRMGEKDKTAERISKFKKRRPPKKGAAKKAAAKRGASKRARGVEPLSRKAPPGVKKAEKVPAWRKGKESSEDKPTQPTLSKDFIKNCARIKPGVKVHLDIYDEELESVVKLIACMTGKNIILAKPLKGKKITIYSPTLVTANEAYRAFLTALMANGFTISRQGRFLRIIDIKQAARYPDPILPESQRPPLEDRMVTQIIGLKNVDAGEINEVLSKLATGNAQFIVYQPTNSLIITESASNLRKLRDLIKDLDVPGGQDQLWTYQIMYADAEEIASKLQEIFEAENQSKSKTKRKRTKTSKRSKKSRSKAESSSVGESDLDARITKVIADERTNRLIIVATARSYRKIKPVIAMLDQEVPGDGQVHILQLNNAKATDLANVLSSLSQEQRSRASTKKRTSRSKKKSKSKAGSTSAALFEGEVSITADEDTNALVIIASLKDYMSLKSVIKELDRPRRQVFIEAVIMEVQVSNGREVGVSMHGSPFSIGGESIPLSSQPGANKSFDFTSAAALTGFSAFAASGDTTSIGGIEIPSFGVLVRALATSNDSNILSTPHILTTDNEEAEIVVGSNVPFISGITGSGFGGTTGASSFFPTVNVQREDVALTLKITPRINAANFVTLEVDQKVEEIESIDPQLGPKTSKRQIKTTVIVKDQHTVVIGGLQRTRQINNKSGVPILGEIPIIGYMFRDSKVERERRNLLLLLTPHVIEGPEDFKAIFERKLEEHREFVSRFHQEDGKIVLGVDYGKKHGLVEAIHKSLVEARGEEALLEELRRAEEGPPLPQDLDGVQYDFYPGAAEKMDGEGTPKVSAVETP